MIATSTGQVFGIQLKDWSPIVNQTYSIPGVLFFMDKLFQVNPDLLRIIILTGDAVRERNSLADSFMCEVQNKAYLPEWFILDLTMLSKGHIQTLSVCQSAKALEFDDVEVNQNLFANGQKVDVLDWDSFRSISSKLCMGEFWHRLAGFVRPGWGVRVSNSIETHHYFSETNAHCGMIRSGYSFPSGFDIRDWDRAENMIETMGFKNIRTRSLNQAQEIIQKFVPDSLEKNRDLMESIKTIADKQENFL